MQQPGFNYHAVIPRNWLEIIENCVTWLIGIGFCSLMIMVFIIPGLSWIISYAVFIVIGILMKSILRTLKRRVSITTNSGNNGGSSIVDAGLDNSAIEALPTFEYKRENSNAGSDFGDVSSECSSCTSSNRWAQCVICLGILKIGDVVKQLQACKHKFHIECIDKWLRLHSTCPMCQSTVLLPASESPV